MYTHETEGLHQRIGQRIEKLKGNWKGIRWEYGEAKKKEKNGESIASDFMKEGIREAKKMKWKISSEDLFWGL